MENNIEQDDNLEVAKQLINAVRQQFEEENKELKKYRNEFYRANDFTLSKFYPYNGPNLYLDRQALVFNIFIAPAGESVDYFKQEVSKLIPKIAQKETPYMIDLFCEVLLHVMKMDIDLYVNKYAISNDGEDYVVAIEYLDKYVAEDAAYLTSDWFRAISANKQFDFAGEFLKLQAAFDKTLFGGPTIYSLVEAGVKLNIPVTYLFEENEFQWGYGKKQLRGRSTTFHTDGIKDTEFTMYKDMVADFLMLCGFPTPIGKNCYDEDEIVKEALKLGFPVVVKPVAGHKGQGVTTGIESEEEVRKAFNKITASAEAEGQKFAGALVQQQVYGTDHRLLAVGGKFVAALERVPAFVDGDGVNTIEKLIEVENDKLIRLDNARSPLCKIKVDDNLKEYLKLQNLSLSSVPKKDEKITLRRVANISAGGVSINVTQKIHPDNVQLVEDIAGYFNVKCLGIDVLSADISKSWRDGNFGIIEINAGPGVFMHLAPAYGGSIDVPEKIMLTHFPKEGSGRIPIIACNQVSDNLAGMINNKLHDIKKDIFFASLNENGVFFNGRYFFNNKEHDQNVKIILRNPKLDFALFAHSKDDIYDYGTLHQGADVIILDEASHAVEDTLKAQLLPGGLLIEIIGEEMKVLENNVEKESMHVSDDKDSMIMKALESRLKDLIYKYE
ncbi:MAG: acetate--CoA ligase family protein [Bacteroidales bacterium]|jgi:cyanophycin synthetase